MASRGIDRRSAELKGRKREYAELKRAVLKPASAFLVERLDRMGAGASSRM